MKYKGLCLALVLVSLLALMVIPHPANAPPWAASLLVSIFPSRAAENAALGVTLDMIDHPLDAFQIIAWIGNPAIKMDSYASAEKKEFDLNCQRWPTGITLPRTLDPATETYKHYQDYSDPWELKAREFRRAIAYLSDKDGYIDRILSGLGCRIDTTVPVPLLAGYVNLDVSNLNYPYRFNPAEAAAVLDAAGFTQGTTPNSFYDPTQPWSAQYIRVDPKGDWSVDGAGTDLKGIIIYARWDDPQRVSAAGELTLMMQKSGIPVNLQIRTKGDCDMAMNLYDYHIYTGSWILSPYPTWVYDLYHSSRYFGGSATSYFDSLSGSTNYVGYCSPEYDVWAEQAYFTTDKYLMKEGVYESQEIYVRDCPVIDLWADFTFKAYDSKWTGMVNMEGYGPDNAWSFFNMMNGADTTIDYGFHNPVDDPHVFSARSAEDKNLIGLMYEGLITLNPFNFAIGEEVGTIADFDNPYEVGLYGTPPKSRVTYHLGSAVFFHSGRKMTPYDAAFSLILFRDVGPAIYRYHSSVRDIDYIEINSAGRPAYARAHADIRDNPALPVNDVAVYFKVASLWAPYWGSQYVMDSYLWLKANDKFGWNFGGTPTYYDTGSGPTPKGVLAYKPWQEDVDLNGAMDMFEDGTGAWQMSGNSGGPAGMWTWVIFTAFASHYWTRAFVSSFLDLAFHRIGNVNWIGAVNMYPAYDTIIDMADGSHVRNAFGSTPEWPHGTGPERYNVDCDFDGDTWIWVMDLYLWGCNYGREMG